jgi:hypothetical protein
MVLTLRNGTNVYVKFSSLRGTAEAIQRPWKLTKRRWIASAVPRKDMIFTFNLLPLRTRALF